MSRRSFAVLLACALVLTSCANILEDEDALRAAIDGSETLARTFIYKETTENREVTVDGAFEDDLKYRARLAENGVGVIEIVIHDDTIAVRFLDVSKIKDFMGPPPDRESAAALEHLMAGEWVIDPSGAPPLDDDTAGYIVEGNTGDNPLLDAIVVFPYMRHTVKESAGVQRWTQDAVRPVYFRQEDVFDAPNEDSGVVRYDLHRVQLPRVEGTQGGPAEEANPRDFHFRKVAFFVEGGRIVRVDEHVDFRSHIDFKRALDEGREDPLRLLKKILDGDIREPIRDRRMRVDITYEDVEVKIPDGPTGRLSGLLGTVESA